MNIMISDETFPVGFDDELDSGQRSSETTITTANETSLNPDSTIEWNKPTASTSCEKTTTFHDASDATASFVSLNASQQQGMPSVLPRAPKKRISFSCQDLLANPRRNSYDHVESKVKKMIAENSSRRKVISRHKSMIVSSQQTHDESFYEDANRDILIQELREKSKLIMELKEKEDEKVKKLLALEEKCDEKDSRIYALEFDRSKMRITFDKLRTELQELKDAKDQYKLQLAMSSPPSRNLRNASSQTLDEAKIVRLNPIVRELTFTTEVNGSLDQTHFSDLNNISSDNLIPSADIEIPLDDIEEVIQEVAEEEEAKKKERKFRGFFKIISCVSSKSTAQ